MDRAIEDGLDSRGASTAAWPGGPIRALLLDVDGTLYRPRPVQVRMGFELLLLPLTGRSITRAVSTWRIIAAFRRLRESLRDVPAGKEPLDRLQFRVTADAVGAPIEEVEAVVREWILERPLRHLASTSMPDVGRVLDDVAARGAKIGFLSDYPAAEKVHALGLGRHLQNGVAFCTTDPEIDAFKPNPRGFEAAATRLGLPTAQVLYVGDRPSVDAAGAERAGMPCAIIARQDSRRAQETARYVQARAFSGYALLWEAIEARVSAPESGAGSGDRRGGAVEAAPSPPRWIIGTER